MMHKKIAIAGVTGLLLMLAQSVAAYSGPEDYLLQQETTFYLRESPFYQPGMMNARRARA